MNTKPFLKKLCFVVFLWGIASYIGYAIYKYILTKNANQIFIEAIKEEKRHYIKKSIKIHNSNTTSDGVSFSDKEEWISQHYLLQEDPDKKYLDSTFAAMLHDKGIQAQSFISYTHKGVTRTTGTAQQMQKTLPLSPVSYHIDTNKNNEIILQPHLELSVSLWAKTPYIYIITLGCIILFFIEINYHIPKRKKEKTNAITEDKEQVPLSLSEASFIPLCDGWKFYLLKRILKKGKQTINLTPTETNYLTLFLKSDNYLLKYTDICMHIYKTYHENETEISRSEKQKIGQAIARLRKSLNSIDDINIISVPNGYKLTYSAH